MERVSSIMDSDHLLDSSKRWLRTGLDAFSHGDSSLDFTVHHLGVAVEHILKAYLARLHPALIVYGRDFDSLLHATGHGDRAGKLLTQTKTISLAEAFGRTKALLASEMSRLENSFQPVIEARNGVAHVGSHDPHAVKAVLTTCIKVITPVLESLGVSPEVHWGPYLRLRDRLLDEHANELAVRVSAKISRAQDVRDRRIAGLADRDRKTTVEVHGNSNLFVSEEDNRVACPACEGEGWLHGTSRVDWEGAVNEDGTPGPIVIFYSYAYDCALCRLHLEGDELEEANLPKMIKIPGVNPHAYEGRDEARSEGESQSFHTVTASPPVQTFKPDTAHDV